MVLIVAGTLLASCASRKDEGAALVRRIGVSRLAAEAASLKSHRGTPQSEFLQEPAWPPAIRELQPQIVKVDAQGVFVQRWKDYVEEEGIFLKFSGIILDTSPGRDPSFTLIAPDTYWYTTKG